MPITPIRIFVSSPGDVRSERERVHKVVQQLNRMRGDRYSVTGFRVARSPNQTLNRRCRLFMDDRTVRG